MATGFGIGLARITASVMCARIKWGLGAGAQWCPIVSEPASRRRNSVRSAVSRATPEGPDCLAVLPAGDRRNAGTDAGFADYLAARGHEVTVISEFPNHPHGVIPYSYRGRLVEDDRSRSSRVLRVWVKASHEKTQRTRISFYLSYMAIATACGVRKFGCRPTGRQPPRGQWLGECIELGPGDERAIERNWALRRIAHRPRWPPYQKGIA